MKNNHNEDNKSAFDYTDKFLKFCNMIITVLMIVFTGYLFIISIFNSSMINFYEILENRSLSEVTVYLKDSPLVHVAAIALTFLLGYLIVNHFKMPSKKTINRILIIIHIIVFVIMFISIFVYLYEPIYDQYNTLKSTYNLLNSFYYDWQVGGVNYVNPWMNSLILFWTIPVSLFGLNGSIIVIRIFNLGMFILASYSFYGFCRETKLNSVFTSIIFVLYMPVVLYIFFVYGNMASISLSVFSIWRAVRLLRYKRKKDALLCAAAITLAALFKDHALITFVAILIVVGIYSIAFRSWKQLLWIPIFIVIYMGSCQAVDTIIETVTGEEIPEAMDVYGHLYMGISEGNRANGWYNDFNTQLLFSYNFDFEKYQSVSKELFQQRLEVLWNDPFYTANFFAKKTASQWNNPTFQSLWIIECMQYVAVVDKRVECTPSLLWIDGTSLNMLFYFVYNLMQSLILFGSLCYFVFEARKAPLPALIPAIAFIGGFIFLFFWEAKAQYTLLFFIMLFPYVVPGFFSLYKGLTSLSNADQKKQWYRSGKVVFLSVLLLLILLISVIDTPFLNNTIKLGNDDEYYNECLEQSVYFFGQLYGID